MVSQRDVFINNAFIITSVLGKWYGFGDSALKKIFIYFLV